MNSLSTLEHFFFFDLQALSGFEKKSASKELVLTDSDNSSVVPEISTSLRYSNLWDSLAMLMLSPFLIGRDFP